MDGLAMALVATWPPAWRQWATRNLLFPLDVITALLTARMLWGDLVPTAPSEAVARAAITRSERHL